MNHEVREATSEDYAALAELQRHTVLTRLKEIYDPEAVERWAWGIHADKFAMLNSEGETILVCGDADSVWGFVSYRASRCHLGMWYVDPDYQGQGVGKALLQAAEEGLSYGHCEEAWTEASLFAIPRFESLGWKIAEHYDKPFAGSAFRVARMTKVLA